MSPLYAQSDGRVKNAVKTAKKLLEKSTESGTEYYLSLLNCRNTPTEGMYTSPQGEPKSPDHKDAEQPCQDY